DRVGVQDGHRQADERGRHALGRGWGRWDVPPTRLVCQRTEAVGCLLASRSELNSRSTNGGSTYPSTTGPECGILPRPFVGRTPIRPGAMAIDGDPWSGEEWTMRRLRWDRSSRIPCMFLTALLTGLTALGQGPPPAAASGDESLIREVVQKYVDARESQDPKA